MKLLMIAVIRIKELPNILAKTKPIKLTGSRAIVTWPMYFVALWGEADNPKNWRMNPSN